MSAITTLRQDAVARTREILVVDDLPEIGQFFTGLLRHLKGFDIKLTTETDPERAIRLLGERRFDLVVSDFRMKTRDGVDVLEAALASNPAAGRILMTGYNEIPTPMLRIRRARIDAYIQKPLRAQDLLLLLFNFLQNDPETLDRCRRAAREVETLGTREESAP
jgi:DNA-binding NtrC family response regulator